MASGSSHCLITGERRLRRWGTWVLVSSVIVATHPRPGPDHPVPAAVGSAPAPARVVLLGKPGCHLCDDARVIVKRVVEDLGEAFVECDITGDPVALRAHGESIPVVFVDGVVIDFWRVSESRLRAALGR